jgi:hypothetical protein
MTLLRRAERYNFLKFLVLRLYATAPLCSMLRHQVPAPAAALARAAPSRRMPGAVTAPLVSIVILLIFAAVAFTLRSVYLRDSFEMPQRISCRYRDIYALIMATTHDITPRAL